MSMSGDEAVGAVFFGVFFIGLVIFALIGVVHCGSNYLATKEAEEICGQYTVKTIYEVDGKTYAICGDDIHRVMK